MAFQLLSEEEVALLDDDVRLQYENEVELYQQRVTFVEQIEKLEGVHLEPYKPKLESITIVDVPETKPVKKVNYVISLSEPINAPKIKTRKLEKIEGVVSVLPEIKGHTDLQPVQVKRIEKPKPIVPTFVKPMVTTTAYIPPKHRAKDMPKVVMPGMDIKQVKIIVDTAVILPEILSDAMFDVKQITISADTTVNLPKMPVRMSKMKPNTPSVNIVSNKKLSLPPVALCLIEKIKYKKLKTESVNLPIIEAITVRDTYFNKIPMTQSALPSVPVVPEQGWKEIQRVEVGEVKLPEVSEVSVRTICVKKKETMQANIAAPIIPNIQAPQVKMPQMEMKELPKVDINAVPKVYTKIKECFVSLNSKK